MTDDLRALKARYNELTRDILKIDDAIAFHRKLLQASETGVANLKELGDPRFFKQAVEKLTSKIRIKERWINVLQKRQKRLVAKHDVLGKEIQARDSRFMHTPIQLK